MGDKKKLRVLSGIQPTGELHLGNYFGMMSRMIEYQNNSDLFCCIVNYHALTTIQDKNTLKNVSNLEKIYDFVKKLHMNYINPLPSYDQPVVNKICIEEKIYDNVLLRSYCLNIMPTDGVEKINLIPNYTMCHFATNVGEHTSKLQRISTVQKVLNMSH